MERPVVVSAPGKVILHGEHAVVYGKVGQDNSLDVLSVDYRLGDPRREVLSAFLFMQAALASSLDLRCYLLILPKQNGAVTLELPDFQLHREWQVAEVIDCLHLNEGDQLQLMQQLAGIDSGVESPPTRLAMLAFLYLLVHIYGEKLKQLSGLSVTVVSTLPASAGLGSSAAYSVCLAAGLQCTLGSQCGRIDGSGNVEKCGSPRISAQSSNSSFGSVSECSSEVDEKRNLTDAVSQLPELIVKKLTDAGYPRPTASSCGGDPGGWSRQELEVINKWGFEAEKLIHGIPSGIDNSISTFGGAIHFQSRKIVPLENMPSIRILLVNTKVPRSTKKMVAGVRERNEKYPEIMGAILNSIESIALRAHRHLRELGSCPVEQQDRAKEEEIYSILQELFTLNQHLLNAIGVGHPALDRVCEVARQFGLSAKLTGGGGGGCAIALMPPDFSGAKLAAVKAAFSEAEFDCWETMIGSRGVSQHCL